MGSNDTPDPDTTTDLMGEIPWTEQAFVDALTILNDYQQRGWFMGGLDRYYPTPFADATAAQLSRRMDTCNAELDRRSRRLGLPTRTAEARSRNRATSKGVRTVLPYPSPVSASYDTTMVPIMPISSSPSAPPWSAQ